MNNRKRKASLSVEATISFTVFIGVMFLLLNMVKLTLFMIILNNTAAETAKTIATLAYPITFLNEAQSGIEKKTEYLKGDKLDHALQGSIIGGKFTDLLGGDPKELMKGGAVNYVKNVAMGAAVKLAGNAVYTVKGDGVKFLVGWFVKNSLDSASFDFDANALYMRMAKIPVTEAEFKAIYTEPVSLSEKGTLKATPASKPDGRDGDFNAEDVVICLEYPVKVIVPMFRGVKVTLRSVAVEHAWLHGVCDGPKRTEGIDLTNLIYGKDRQVYIAAGGYGKRYHVSTCGYLHDSPDHPKRSLSRAEAINQGLTPCKVCKPDNNDKK